MTSTLIERGLPASESNERVVDSFSPEQYLQLIDDLAIQLRKIEQEQFSKELEHDGTNKSFPIFVIDPSKIDSDQMKEIATDATTLALLTPDDWVDYQFIELLAHSYDVTNEEAVLERLRTLSQQESTLVQEVAELPQRLKVAATKNIGIVAAANFTGHKDIQFTHEQAAKMNDYAA